MLKRPAFFIRDMEVLWLWPSHICTWGFMTYLLHMLLFTLSEWRPQEQTPDLFMFFFLATNKKESWVLCVLTVHMCSGKYETDFPCDFTVIFVKHVWYDDAILCNFNLLLKFVKVIQHCIVHKDSTVYKPFKVHQYNLCF